MSGRLAVPIVLIVAVACGSSRTPLRRASTLELQEDAPRNEASGIVARGFVERFACTGGFEQGRPTHIRIPPDGEAVLYLRSGPRSFEQALYELDVESGNERKLLAVEGALDGASVELSARVEQRRERMRTSARGITRFELSPDGSRVLVPLSGKLFVVDRESGDVRQLIDEGGYAHAAHFSPDGRKVGCVRNDDLYVIDLEDKTQHRITNSANEHITNGLPEFIAQEEMKRYRGWWWGPESRRIAYQRTDTSEVETLYRADPMHPSQKPRAEPYPLAGTTNADVRLGVARIRGERTRWIDWERETLPYLAKVRWSQGAPLTLLVQNRPQTEARLLAASPSTGRTRTLLVETDDEWVSLDPSVPRWIQHGKRFLWSTQRNGRWQLELRARNGDRVRALTAERLGYDELLHVDERHDVAWVAASTEPTETHIWRVPLTRTAESKPSRVTRAPGVHDGAFGHSTDLWAHRARTLEHGVQIVARRNGQLITPLPDASESPPFVAHPRLLTVGERDFRAVVLRPRDFRSGEAYPVLVSVYGGPGYRIVRADRERYLLRQWMANQGYIVVAADGRGTPGRGRKWERAIAGKLGEVPVADQVAALKALQRRIPEMDRSRVGIFGWSYGGYVAAMAAMQKPAVFHAAIAGAPVSDWQDYDTHYTERYLGLPRDHADRYQKASLLTHAQKLRRPLLIVHGTMDDNVYFRHALELSDALLRARRPHNVLPLSGLTHRIGDPEMTVALQIRMMRFFDSTLDEAK